MPRKPPRRTERPNAPGRCPCMGGHTQGLATATRKTKGNYWTEPSAPTALHMSVCPHSELARCTPQSYGPPKKAKRPKRQIDRIVT